MVLNKKQKRFVEEYLIDLNAAAAARRAGYSEKTAKEMGYENLTKPHIQSEIQKAIADRSERTGITQDIVLRDIHLVKQDAMSKKEDGQMIDRQAALKACELEGRHLKMFTDKIDMNARVNVEEELDELD